MSSNDEAESLSMTAAANDWLTDHEFDLDNAAGRRFVKVFREVSERYDDDHVRDAALLAAAKYLAGLASPSDVGKTLAKARLAAESQLAAARIIATLAVTDGSPESTTANEVGVDRMALRRWLGKR